MEIIEPAKAARIMAPEPMDTDLLKKNDHQKRHDQLGTGRDSQYKGSRDRIVKKGLQQKSGNRKCSTKDDHCQYPGKTDLPDDIIRSFISLMPEYDIQDLLHREVDTSGIYIPYK